MNTNISAGSKAKIHNTAVLIITVLCLGTVFECAFRGWEFWMIPVIIGGAAACWIIHFVRIWNRNSREDFYMIFAMLVIFFHGVHQIYYYEVIIYSMLLMAVAVLIKRMLYLRLLLAEFFLIMMIQIVWSVRAGGEDLYAVLFSQIMFQITVEICIYATLSGIVRSTLRIEQALQEGEEERASAEFETEDFLANISHELRTPVNVISGMSSLILKKERREDVESIRDAGIRLSRQIEDIQDYSEIQRGEVRLEEERYMITTLLGNVIEEYSRTQKAELELVVDLDPRVPAVLKGDVKKLNKILRHLLSNAEKFTVRGGIYLRVIGIRRDYGINLILEVTDTGIGMSRSEIEKVSAGFYQANKKRNRSTGGIGLGLSIVYGFVRRMNGFVVIESEKNKGTTVRISVAQEVLDPAQCLEVRSDQFQNAVLLVNPDKYQGRRVGAFYKAMAENMASGLRLNLYAASSTAELDRILERGDITHVFMSDREYLDAPAHFDALSKTDVVVAVAADRDFSISVDSRVITLFKPLGAYQIAGVLSGERDIPGRVDDEGGHPVFDGIRALIVDDEPMNLIVASGLFRDYQMIIGTADSGADAIEKYQSGDYELVFMDHMMPGMDGVEAMQKIRDLAVQMNRRICVIALTANAMSGAREMFLREGFDGFISKPIDIGEFERTMSRLISEGRLRRGGTQ